MMRSKTNLSKPCHICIGCGRCVEENRKLHVLTEYGKAFDEAAADAAALLRCDNGEYFVAVDIGTTTVAMELCGADGRGIDTYVTVNPQSVFGADVLSRISAAESPARALQMQMQIRKVLEQGFAHFRRNLKEEEKLRAVIAANTTMIYLLMGWNTGELGHAPFRAAHLAAQVTEIGGVPCYLFPGLSAFVGGDIVAGIMASGMLKQEEITLLIDLGTNGEMVLGNQERLMACSTAAGPAFEGGVNRGIWGADIVSLLARLTKEGIVDETGALAEPYFEEGVCIGGVRMTQQAIRAIQLAKGAVAAGIQILAQEYGIDIGGIDKVILAGGFGYYLSPKAAAEIGLFPRKLCEKTQSGGNMALAGARMLGERMSIAGAEDEWNRFWTKNRLSATIIQLAEVPCFQEKFLEAMELKPI